MITRNLQTVSKNASNVNKCMLQHVNKRNIMITNNTLSTNPISITLSTPSINNKSQKSNSNSCITYNAKYCFSKTQKSKQKNIPFSIKDIVPSNIKLSAKEQTNIESILTNLYNTEQTELIELIAIQLESSPRQPLQSSFIQYFTEKSAEIIKNIKKSKDKTYVILNVIESTPIQSENVAISEMKLLFDTDANKSRNDLYQGIIRNSRSCQNIDIIHHGWITSSSKSTTKSRSPMIARDFVKALNIKSKSIVIAAVDKEYKKELKTFQDVLIYALSLDTNYGGFHDIPKWAPSEQTDALEKEQEIQQENDNDIVKQQPQSSSSSVIAKSTQTQKPIDIGIVDTNNRTYYQSSEMSWDDPEDIKQEEDERNLVPEVERIQEELKKRAERQQYREIHLTKWSNDLKEREENVDKQKQEIIEKDSDIKQQEISINTKEKEQLITSDNLKYQRLNNKRNASELMEKKETLNIMEQKLNEQQSKQFEIQQKLEKQQKILNDEEIRLNKESESILQREQSMKEREETLTQQTAKLKQNEDALEKNQKISNKKMMEIEEKATDLKQQSKQLKIDQDALKKDKVELKRLQNELKKNQNTYNIQIKELEEEKIKFNKDKKQFDIDQKALKDQEALYDKNMTQLRKEEKIVKEQLEMIEMERSEINKQKKEISLQQRNLDESIEQLQKDRSLLNNDKQSLQEQQTKLKQSKDEQREQFEMEANELKDNLKYQRLNNKRNASELMEKKETLNVMEQKLNEQQSKQFEVQQKLEKQQKILNDEEIRLNKESESILQREQSMKEREQTLTQQTAKLKQNEDALEKNQKILNKKMMEIDEKATDLKQQSNKLKIDQDALKKDKVEWNEKISKFKQKDEELSKKQSRFKQMMDDLEKQEKKVNEDAMNNRMNQDINKRKENELDLKEKQLTQRETELLEREKKYKLEESVLIQNQKEWERLQDELKKNQNTYNIQIKELEEEKIKFNKDKHQFDIDQKALKNQEALYDKNMSELRKEEKIVKEQLKMIEMEQSEINKQKKEISLQQKNLAESIEQLQKDRSLLNNDKQSLQEQQTKLKQSKDELNQKREKTEKKFVELNAQRNALSNDQIKAKKLQNELETKEKELGINIKKNEQKEEDIVIKYDKMKKEEQETMAKIEPIKQKEKQLNDQEQSLQKKQKIYNQQENELNKEKTKQIEQREQLEMEANELKDKEIKLTEWNEKLETKQHKISEQDRRIVKRYDEFNEEKYKVIKLNNSLGIKETEIADKEKKLKLQQQNIEKTQMEIYEQKQNLLKEKQELSALQNEFHTKQISLERREKDYQQRSDKFESDQFELDKISKDYKEKQKILDEEWRNLNSEKDLIKEQNDYIKQQNQALNIQKKHLDEKKIKIDSNSLLLTTQQQQLMNQTEAQNVKQLKLEKIKNDLQTAQEKHKREDEKLILWAKDLQNEQKRLDEMEQELLKKTKNIEENTFILTQKEVKLEKLATFLEKEKMELQQNKITQKYEFEKKTAILEEQEKTLKLERDSQKEKEELIQLTKQQIEFEQKGIMEKEQKLSEEEKNLNKALKEAQDTTYDLKIKITQKESEISMKEDALKDRDIMISKEERKIKEKESELKETEQKLKILQHDLEAQSGRMRNEFKKTKKEIENERMNIMEQKSKLSEQKESVERAIKQQKMIETEDEQDLNREINILRAKCDELQNELMEMEENMTEKTKSLEIMDKKLINENVELFKENQLLQRQIADNQKKEKQLKRPIDAEKLKLRHEQIANQNKAEEVKHIQSGLKRQEGLIESRGNKIIKQEQELTDKQLKQQQQQSEIDKLTDNLQIQLLRTEKAEKEAKEAALQKDLLINRLQNENNQLKAQLSDTTISIDIKDVIPTQYVQSVTLSPADPISKISKRNKPFTGKIKAESIPINDPLKTSKSILLKPAHTITKDISSQIEEIQSVLKHPKDSKAEIVTAPIFKDKIATQYVKSVPLNAAQPTAKTSKLNITKLPSYNQPKSIDINPAKTPSFTLLSSPQQTILDLEDEEEELRPKRIPVTIEKQPEEPRKFRPYRPKKEKPRTLDVDAFIETFEPTKITVVDKVVSHPTEKQIISESSLPPRDTIYTKDVKPVSLSAAEPTTMTSKRNEPKIQYISPSSISINDPTITSQKVVSTPSAPKIDTVISHPIQTGAVSTDSLPPKDVIATSNVASISLSATQPTSVISKSNQPKIQYISPSSISINDPELTSKIVISSPSAAATDTVILHPIETRTVSADSLPPKDTIATHNVSSISLCAADPVSVISKRNQPKTQYITASSIAINDAQLTSKTVVSAPSAPSAPTTDTVVSHPADSRTISVDSLPPKDTITTSNIESISLSAAEPVSVISAGNQPKTKYIAPSSISINDPQLTSKTVVLATSASVVFTTIDTVLSHPTKTGAISVEYLPPKDVIATANVPSISLSAAVPTSVISKRNEPKIQYISPSSISINDPQLSSRTVVSAPCAPKTDTVTLHPISLSAAEPVSVISARNQPKTQYITASSIAINDPQLTSKTVVSAPSAPSAPTTDTVISPPADSRTISVDSLPPKDTIATSNVPSISLSAAETVSVISSRNQTKPQYIAPSSISINDPQLTSKTVISAPTTTKPTTTTVPAFVVSHPAYTGVLSMETLPPKDTIATQTQPSVSLFAAQPTSVISKTNQPKIQYITPSSIPINDPQLTSKAVVTAPQQIPSIPSISVDTIKPKDVTFTQKVASIPLCAAEPTSMISKRNRPKTTDTVPEMTKTILPTQLSEMETITPTISDDILLHPTATRTIYKGTLDPKDTIATKDIDSVDLISAPPTSMISRYNEPKLAWYNIPSCIPINIISEEDIENVLCHPISLSVDTSIIEATDNVLYHPSTATMIDSAKFARDIGKLKELQKEEIEIKDEEIEPELASITEFEESEESEPEFKSNLTAIDLDALFQCRTNPDLLFDDIGHIETIFVGLNKELQDCLIECRDYKSMINPLPSMFQSNIVDLTPNEENIFNGDVICCLEWKFNNDQFETLCDDIQDLIGECDKSIDGNRELMEEYKIALKDDNKRSISNRNKLRAKNKFSRDNTKNIYDINKNGGIEFKNDLSTELLELQYKNTEWLFLRSTLQEWMKYIQGGLENDSAAIHSSDAIYLRSFCILPSQSHDIRENIAKHSKHLENELKNRKWVNGLNNLLSTKCKSDGNFTIFYGEMGPNVANWEDKLLCRDLTSYLLNGINFELKSDSSTNIPLSEGFVRIGYQSQLLIECAQSLLGHIDPYIEQIVFTAQNWAKRDDNIYGDKKNINGPPKLQLSLKNGQKLANIDPLTLMNKTPLQRAKLLENDEKYISLFKDPLSTDLNELLQDISTRKIDQKYIKKLHKFLASYFEILYRDKLMLPTPNSTIIEETAPETWQKHALLEAVFSDEFGKILELLSNESLTRQICHFISYDVYDMRPDSDDQKTKQLNEDRMYNELFLPFQTFKEYHTRNIKSKLYEIVSDFDIQQYLSDNIYNMALQKVLDRNKNKKKKKDNKWSAMSYIDKLLSPQQFCRDDALERNEDDSFPIFSFEERLATFWSGYLKGILNNVPVEKPLRLNENYHDIEPDDGYLKHLKQHYFIDSYKPPSNEDIASRISMEDRMNGVDIYRDKYIQRPHQSKRILQTQLKFLYHNKLDYMRGAFPLENFNYLPYDTKQPIKHRVTVRKSPFVHARAQENYETRIYTKVATNYKLTSNRTADMFNARGFDIIYDSIRIM